MAKRGGFPGGMPGNMNNLMKQAAENARQRKRLPKSWKRKSTERPAGGGAVTVTVSG